MIVYISGAMSTRTPAEFEEEFDWWARALRRSGHIVISPVDLDLGDYTKDYRDCLARDLFIIMSTDPGRVPGHFDLPPTEALVMLPSWRDSEGGCQLEKFAAEVVGIKVLDVETMEPIEELPAVRT